MDKSLNQPSAKQDAAGPSDFSRQLFRDIAKRPLPFGAEIDDGCFWRSEAVCRYLFGRGFTPKNAWAFASGDKKMSVTLPSGKKAKWWYHIAPALAVASQSGIVEDMVFDTVLFEMPVSFDRWAEYLAAADRQVLDYGIVPEGYKNKWSATS